MQDQACNQVGYTSCIINLLFLIQSIYAQNHDTNFHLYNLSDYEEAKCLDGSPPVYYYSKASNSQGQNKFLIYFNGGGWCLDESLNGTLEQCYQRTQSEKGSSLFNEIILEDIQGIVSNNVKQNPMFYNWNRIFVPYCDGTGRQGFSTKPYIFNNTKIWFRGMNNTISYFQDFIRRLKINEAEQVILSGCSVGGLAAITWSNYLRNILPTKTKLHIVSDAGFFVDYQDFETKQYSFRQRLKNVMYYSNQEADPIIKECAEEYINEKWKCIFFAKYMLKYIKVPIFVIQPQYDIIQLDYILNMKCVSLLQSKMDQCNDESLQEIEMYRQYSIKELTDSITSYNNRGTWYSSCFGHCVLYFSYLMNNQKYAIKLNHYNTAVYSLFKWINNIYDDDNNHIYIDSVPWPQNQICAFIFSNNSNKFNNLITIIFYFIFILLSFY